MWRVVIHLRLALARANHTVTIIGSKAYIFGGEGADGKITSTDIHAVVLPGSKEAGSEYACYPAAPLEDAHGVISARTKHAACSRGKHVVVHGGCNEDGSAVEEGSCLWLWDSERLKWAKVIAGGK